MITFALFDFTKGIYEAWFKMLLGYVIYPGLHFAFLALMLATFDSIYFGDLKLDSNSPSVFEQCKSKGSSESPICAIANNIEIGSEIEGVIGGAVAGTVIAGKDIIEGKGSGDAIADGISEGKKIHDASVNRGKKGVNSSLRDMCDMNIGHIIKGLYETVDLWILGSFTKMSSSVVDALFLTMLKLALMAFLFFMLMNSISTFFAYLTGVESVAGLAKGDLSGAFKSAFGSMAQSPLKAIKSATSKGGGGAKKGGGK